MPKVRRSKLNLRRAAARATSRPATTRNRKSAPARTQEDEEIAANPVAGQTGGERSSSTSGGDKDQALSLVSGLRKLFLSHISTHPECASAAPQMKKYMRNQFELYGIKAPARRIIRKEFVQQNRDRLQHRTLLLNLVPLLWEQEERDYQYLGQDLLSQFRQELLGSSDEEFHEAVSLAKTCITSKSWWDTVDALSYPVVGYFVRERPSLGVPIMQEWIKEDNMWLRRVAILHQLCQKSKTDEQLLFSFCLERSHETEFFIRKAIGWALRDYSKTNKKAVRDFVEKNRDSLSGLSIREALKYC